MNPSSLGYHTQSRSHARSLPGTVSGQVARPRKPVSENTKHAVLARISQQIKRENQLRKAASSTVESQPVMQIKESKTEPDSEDTKASASSEHFVFATACFDLKRSTGETIAKRGERVMLVYPMRSSNKFEVEMRIKQAKATTGQLSYSWVVIFDEGDGKRFVKDFSVIQ